MRRYVYASLALTMIGVATELPAQDTEWNRYSLEELGGVFVRAEASPACESAGLTVDVLRMETESTLLEAEVEILTEQEMLRNPALPELRITVECAEGGSAGFAYAVSVRVQQSVQMTRDPQVQLSEAVTWYTTTVGIGASGSAAQEALQESTKGRVEEFAAAYVAANNAAADPTGGSPR